MLKTCVKTKRPTFWKFRQWMLQTIIQLHVKAECQFLLWLAFFEEAEEVLSRIEHIHRRI